MENINTQPVPKRTRRSAEQWHAILNEHFATGEMLQELANRLGCALSTVEMQMKSVTAPATGRPSNPIAKGFVEINPELSERNVASQTALRLRTEAGVVAEFAQLPPACYVAEALGWLSDADVAAQRPYFRCCPARRHAIRLR